MKTYKNIIKLFPVLVLMSIGMASCNDWLTVHPQTQIVEENFWEDKNDLEGVRYAVYKNMASQVEKMIIWGDLRAVDTYTLPSSATSQQNRNNFRNLIQADIDTTWSYYDWSGMYSTIGYCNKVLQHGDEILAKDKQFTASEWRQMKAEMVTMRALCYFYLVRAFKSIPYTTKVVNSDTEVEMFPQLPVIDVMDSIILDVESVKGQARNRFVDIQETKGMITNAAIYAILSDMYLWRASILEGRGQIDKAISDYQACIENSELSISKLADQYEEEIKSHGSINSEDYLSWISAPTFAGKTIKFMYKNNVKDANRGNLYLKAYSRIFGEGNSHESIFELQFNKSDGRANNSVNSMWGAFEGAHLVSVFYDRNSEEARDSRYWFNCWNYIEGQANATDYFCMKWSKIDINFNSKVGTKEVEILVAPEQEQYNNWIIYRLSDVLLQNAEARACLSELNVNKADNKEICHRILRMINRRWYANVVSGGEVETDVSKKIKYDEAYITDSCHIDVMNTRKIELMSEGKRWFDLVRYAERHSANDESVEGKDLIFDKFMSNINGIVTTKNRCENLWGLYSPIYYMECKAYRANGSNITQNPVWNKSKYDR